MDGNIERHKKEIIHWIDSLEDESIIRKLLDLKEKTSHSVNESKAEYLIKDDFEERWAKGISHDEMKRRTLEYISNLPWKD